MPMTHDNSPNAQTQRPAPSYSASRSGGGTLYTAGTLGLDPDTGAVPDASRVSEVHQMMRNLETTLAHGGYTLNDVISTTVYVTTFDFYRAYDEAYRTYFEQPYPARTTVQVAGLVAGCSIEISAIAHRS
jgi:2-iminobutanoate/2-iminopropanoate deaminase